MPGLSNAYLSELVKILLHIFDGSVDGQSSNKDLLCPGHQLPAEKKTTDHIRQGVKRLFVFVSVFLSSNASASLS